MTGMKSRKARDKRKAYRDQFYKTPIIKLPIPFVNFFITGKDMDAFQRLTGMKSQTLFDIAVGNKVYDKETRQYIEPSRTNNVVYDADRYLIGGAAILDILKNVDTYSRLESWLYRNFIVPSLTKDAKNSGLMIGEIINTGEDFTVEYNGRECNPWLFNTWFYVADDPENYERDPYETIEEIRNTQLINLFKEQFNTYLITMSFEQNPNQFYNMIQDVLAVLPIGYRPDIENREHYVSTLYNKIVECSESLNASIRIKDVTLLEVQQKYQTLLDYISMLQFGKTLSLSLNHINIEKQKPDSYKSLAETLAGKKGLVRGQMFAGRTDYSARSVITCDRNMPIDHVGVPIPILRKLAILDIITDQKGKPCNALKNMSYLLEQTEEAHVDALVEEICKDAYITPGRQPTLWRIGVQAFKVVPTHNDTITLSPLVVEPFNADFDGDQMHLEWAITEEGKADVRNYMASTKNMYYPQTGALIVKPRLEILYGLWQLTSKHDLAAEGKHHSAADVDMICKVYGIEAPTPIERLVKATCENLIAINDTVNASDYPYTCKESRVKVGIEVLKWVFGKTLSEYAIGVVPLTKYSEDSSVEDKEFTNDWYEALIADKVSDTTWFVDMVTRLTQVGFEIAELYPPGLSVLPTVGISDLVNDFMHETTTQEVFVNRGFVSDEDFSTYYKKPVDDLTSAVSKRIVKELGEDNGFVKLVNSKAKGKESDLCQIFGFKGQIMKNNVEAFNSIIATGYAEGLTGYDQAVAAYGGRKGLCEKVLSTAKPGYLTHKLSHATAHPVIRMRDCGTQRGTLWTLADFKAFLPHIDAATQFADNYLNSAKALFFKVIEGHHWIDNGVTMPMVKDRATSDDIFNRYVATLDDEHLLVELNGVEIRSPLTCQCHMCQTCYGYDWVTHSDYPDIGTPVGPISSQAITQPGTQMTMKNFQSGGVAGKKNLTSSFDTMAQLFDLTPLASNKASDYMIMHDPISPIDGIIKRKSIDANRDEVWVFNPETKKKSPKWKIASKVKCKKSVEAGESIFRVEDVHCPIEIEQIRGYDAAAKYMVLRLDDIYVKDPIKTVHFEVVVASLTQYIVMYSQNEEVLCGAIINGYEKWCYIDDIATVPTLIGAKAQPKYRQDFLDSINMEGITQYIPRAMACANTDYLSNPVNAIMLGQVPNIGSTFDPTRR